jgi:hypothetical protein
LPVTPSTLLATNAVSTNKEKRLAELKMKDTLTNAEMDELIQLSPSGTFKSGPNLLTIGVIDVDNFFRKLTEGAEISNKAFEQGFYIETISLRLQHIEIYLRMFYVVKNKNGKLIDGNTDKRTFCNFLSDCEQLDFRKDLLIELRDFNSCRIKAIHKYLLGEVSYDALQDVCLITKGLDAKVREYVLKDIRIVML